LRHDQPSPLPVGDIPEDAHSVEIVVEKSRAEMEQKAILNRSSRMPEILRSL
jgi:hypothetical protein